MRLTACCETALLDCIDPQWYKEARKSPPPEFGYLDMMTSVLRCVTVVLLIAQIGCNSEQASPPSEQTGPSLSDLPIELTVKQRSTTTVPGSGGALRLTIGDITGGQVMASLADAEGTVVLADTSLASGDEATFHLGTESYQLELKELSNALVGEDFASFVISSATAGSESEAQKIEKLIAAVASAEGLVFIRNGVEHSAEEAAEHLRTKWQAAGEEIETAQQFIDELGSKSSLSGEPYRIRLPDGTEMPAGKWLRDKLNPEK